MKTFKKEKAFQEDNSQSDSFSAVNHHLLCPSALFKMKEPMYSTSSSEGLEMPVGMCERLWLCAHLSLSVSINDTSCMSSQCQIQARRESSAVLMWRISQFLHSAFHHK